MPRAFSRTRRSTPRGQISSAGAANSQRKNSVPSSHGISRQLSGRMRTWASG